MNLQVLRNGLDVTNEVVTLSTEHNICNAIGTAIFQMQGKSTTVYSPGDIMVLYLNGTKIGTYLSFRVEKSLDRISIHAQNDSYKLSNYFVSDSYFIDYPTFCKYWIEKFLTEAGVTYSFSVAGNGTLLQNDTTLGMSMVEDIINPLLQQSGWYLIYDEDNNVSIGELTKNPDNSAGTISQVISIQTHEDDLMLRNRGIVWGKSNPYTQTWVHAYRDRITGYETWEGDVRSVLCANSNIWNNSDANLVASQLVNEFAKTTYVKTVTIVGTASYKLGDTLFLNTDYFTGYCLVTNVQHEVSKSGFVTTLTLDQRCPRIIAFFSSIYVYVGTNGSGVWRKAFTYPDSWADFSTGIPAEDKSITDLKVYDGVFACVANWKLYYRNTGTSWIKYDPISFTDDEEVTYTDFLCAGCAIDRSKETIYAVYMNQFSGKSWFVEIDVSGRLRRKTQIISDEGNNLRAFDVDYVAGKSVVTAHDPGSGGSSGYSPNYFGLGTEAGFLYDSWQLEAQSDPILEAEETYVANVHYTGATVKNYYLTVFKVNLRTSVTTQLTTSQFIGQVPSAGGTDFNRIAGFHRFSDTHFRVGLLYFPAFSQVAELRVSDYDDGNWITINGYPSVETLGTSLRSYSYSYRGNIFMQEQFTISPGVFNIDQYIVDISTMTKSSVWSGLKSSNDYFGPIHYYGDSLLMRSINTETLQFRQVGGTAAGLLDTGIYNGSVKAMNMDENENYGILVQDLVDYYIVRISDGNVLNKGTRSWDDANGEDQDLNVANYGSGHMPFIFVKNASYSHFFGYNINAQANNNITSIDCFVGFDSVSGYMYGLKKTVIDEFTSTYNLYKIDSSGGIVSELVLNSPESRVGPYDMFINNNIIAFTGYEDVSTGDNTKYTQYIFNANFNTVQVGTYVTALENGGTYTIIDTTFHGTVLEVDQELPIVNIPLQVNSPLISGWSVSGLTAISTLVTNFRVGFPSGIGGWGFYSPVYGNAFTDIQYAGAAIRWIDDVRTFYTIPPSQVTVTSVSGISENEWIAIAVSGSLLENYVTFSGGWLGVGALSGITKIETGNFDLAYFAYGSGRFYQQVSYGDFSWEESSTNLPSSEVTVIRVDDLL